jgi:predicted ester cyclase
MSHATGGGGQLTDASNIALLRKAQEEMNRKELTTVRSLCTDETVCHFPDRTCTGVDEIVAYFEASFAALPDRHLEMIAMTASGEDVLLRFRLTATHDGSFGDIPATGKPIAIDGFEHFVMRDGKLVESFALSDQLQLARQLGMIGPDGSVGDRVMKFAFRVKTKLSRAPKRAGTPKPPDPVAPAPT